MPPPCCGYRAAYAANNYFTTKSCTEKPVFYLFCQFPNLYRTKISIFSDPLFCFSKKKHQICAKKLTFLNRVNLLVQPMTDLRADPSRNPVLISFSKKNFISAISPSCVHVMNNIKTEIHQSSWQKISLSFLTSRCDSMSYYHLLSSVNQSLVVSDFPLFPPLLAIPCPTC